MGVATDKFFDTNGTPVTYLTEIISLATLLVRDMSKCSDLRLGNEYQQKI